MKHIATSKNGCVLVLGSALFCSVMLGCSGANNAQPAASSSEPAAATTKLPMSLNEVMVALTDRSAEPFWSASQNLPKDQRGWDELEYNAMQLALSGVVISFPGTGAADAGWVAQPEWQTNAKKLTDIGMRALAAVKVKNGEAIAALGTELVELCEGCHTKFKPDIPTQGILMHSEYYKPKSEGESAK
jgi:hypothetical protein